MNNKVLVAMSGGVDSSVAAYLLKKEGYDCTGVTIKMFNDGLFRDTFIEKEEKSCCSINDVEDARSVAFSLGLPFYVCNFSEEFEKCVIHRFVDEYERGATPNPCIDCNKYIKFGKLYSRAESLGIDHVATGHYAKIEHEKGNGRYLLKKAADLEKDQSYVLYFLSQEQLKRALFPLGGMTKDIVRETAALKGFVNAKKTESQDICFVPDGDYASFIEQYTGKQYPCGDFIGVDGDRLGKHKGIIRYTIGQRKGLGVAFGEPMFVCSKSAADNTVTLCDGANLFKKTVYASGFNWIAMDKPLGTVRVRAKLRYKQPEQPAYAEQIDDDTVRVEFDEPQRAPATGQAVVLYDGDVVIGGGTIS